MIHVACNLKSTCLRREGAATSYSGHLSRTTVKRLPILYVLIVTAGIAGCTSSPHGLLPAQPNPNTVNIVAVDRSDSTGDMREDLNKLVAFSYSSCVDRGQQFAVWAVDRESYCLYGPRPALEDRLPNNVFNELQRKGHNTAFRTRPAKFWEAMAKRYQQSPTVVRMAYLTDGGNDYAADGPRIRKAVKRLAANERVFVAIAGVRPNQREWLEEAFAPFGSRFRIGTLGEESQVIREWFQLGAELDRR